MKQLSTDKTTAFDKWSNYVLAAIFALVPMHAFITVSLASAVGHYDALRIWKEILLLLLTPIIVWLLWRTPGLGDRMKRGWLFWAIACYIVLYLVLGLVALYKGQVNAYAMAYSWISNLRLMVVFVLAYIVASRSGWLRAHWEQLLLYSAAIVVGFGLLQLFVLPTNFLQHFGYSPATIMPFDTVDQKTDYVRVQSTLRGANPLGAYLVLALGAVIVLLLKSTRDRRQIMGVTMLSAGLIILISTYSRSAYVGILLTGLTAVLLVVHGQAAKKRLAWGLVALVVLAVISFFTLRTNDRFENIFFHTDEHSQSSASSNDKRTTALQSGVRDVVNQPFGGGPGTAGPASAHNDAPARIAEDYYLQVGQEVGWLGMVLFIVIVCSVAWRLFKQRTDPLSRTLLAALVGLSFINLISHAWTDDTIGILWWGLAGVALAPAILKKETTSKNNGKSKKIKTV